MAFDSISDQNTRFVLYKDKFCELTESQLKIFNYYMLGKSKQVSTGDIKAVYYEPHKFDVCKTKTWGKTLSPVWWAMDLKRAFGDGTNVVVDNGEKTWKGFSVKNIDVFLNVLRKVLKTEATVEDKFPFSVNVKAEEAD